MGCDIHLYKEKKVNGEWVTADTSWEIRDPEYETVPNIDWRDNDIDRDYVLFGLLVDDVRKSYPYSFPERELPVDTCPEVRAQSNEYGLDGHSHSYISVTELREKSVELLLEPTKEVVHWQLKGLARIISLFDGIGGDDHRIVFWFDN